MMTGSSFELIVIGFVLIACIAVYGWLDYRRTNRNENIGLAMVKNRLNDTQQSR